MKKMMKPAIRKSLGALFTLIALCFSCLGALKAEESPVDQKLHDNLYIVSFTHRLDNKDVEMFLTASNRNARHICTEWLALRLFAWRMVVYQAKQVVPGQYWLKYMSADESYFGDYYKCKPVTIDGSLAIVFDAVSCAPVKVAFNVKSKNKDDLLFGCLVRGYRDGQEPAAYSLCLFADDDDQLDVSAGCATYSLRVFVRDNRRWFFGKEIVLSNAKAIQKGVLQIDIVYDKDRGDPKADNMVKMGRIRMRESDAVQGSVSIVPNFPPPPSNRSH